jgi:hypothetical protein
VVSERLGHSSVAFAQQVYMHVIPGMDAEDAWLAATAILGTVSGPNSPGDAHVTEFVTTGRTHHCYECLEIREGP